MEIANLGCGIYLRSQFSKKKVWLIIEKKNILWKQYVKISHLSRDFYSNMTYTCMCRIVNYIALINYHKEIAIHLQLCVVFPNLVILIAIIVNRFSSLCMKAIWGPGIEPSAFPQVYLPNIPMA